MADGAIKAAWIRPQSSSLNVFWASSTLRTPGILAAIGHAAARLNPSRGISRRATGRHAAPARERAPRRRHGLADIPYVAFADTYSIQIQIEKGKQMRQGKKILALIMAALASRGPGSRNQRGGGQRELPRPSIRREHVELRQRHLRRLLRHAGVRNRAVHRGRLRRRDHRHQESAGRRRGMVLVRDRGEQQ